MILAALALISLFFAFPGLSQQTSPDFAREIQPILNARCAGCHSGKTPQAGLGLHTRAEMLKGGVSGPAIVPGSSADSLLMARITGQKTPVMPMSGGPLSTAEIELIRKWIDAGAPGAAGGQPLWTPVLAPRRVDPPAGSQFANPIDRFVADYFQKRGIHFAEAVSDEVFLRRAYLDLWGLLPTPEQRERFLKDQSKNKRPNLIDELLSGRQNYSEHWVSFWNDLLHNDEGVTYIGDRKSITGWLLDSLVKNRPYDQFARTLLNPGEGAPEGFLMGVNWRGDVNASQTPVMQAAQNSAQVFLGINLKCNSCHDSFISHWKLKDAYGLASFYSEQPLEIVRCDVKTGETAQPRFLYPVLGGVSAQASLAEKRAAAARLFTLPENGRFARTFVNRIWARLFGIGLVHPVDDMDAEPWNADLLDWLASDFADHGYDVDYLLRAIMTSRAYQLPAVAASGAKSQSFIFRGPLYRRLSAEQFVDAVSSLTGEWRVLQPRSAGEGIYSREWRLKASNLTRALGRPTRDAAVTERAIDPSTLQALELVNGETVASLLHRGAKRMLGQLPAAPPNRFDSGAFRAERIAIDIDVSGARELRLLLQDYDTYDPSRVIAGWASAKLIGPSGDVDLATLKASAPVGQGELHMRGAAAQPALIVPVPSELVYAIAGKGFTRFRATVGVDESSLQSDISPNLRAFVFTEEPDRKQLVRVKGEPPVPVPSGKFTVDSIIARVYRHALGRDPVAEELASAREFFAGGATSDGLEDFLWSLTMSPEFQFIR